MTISTGKTAKVTIEGQPDIVEAVAGRIKEYFTVTYESKDRELRLSPDSVSRFLRVLPPNQAHQTDLPFWTCPVCGSAQEGKPVHCDNCGTFVDDPNSITTY